MYLKGMLVVAMRHGHDTFFCFSDYAEEKGSSGRASLEAPSRRWVNRGLETMSTSAQVSGPAGPSSPLPNSRRCGSSPYRPVHGVVLESRSERDPMGSKPNFYPSSRRNSTRGDTVTHFIIPSSPLSL